MNAEQRLTEAKELFEEYLSIGFISGEQGMGPIEREVWEARVIGELKNVLGARTPCMCFDADYADGQHYPGCDHFIGQEN